ncbi:DUF922 domain-containing Zn-dependent protease [Rhizobium sp. SSA_523]|uniref:DUF922 domain-containing Zn-dependent protease n=1 Tax=Rhizobium sp. SSA_523 TaxID=2952477 RepID=UPI0020916282|nr:DUF922 domain-containing protein [Rhizobium sp. SSA_523]MCO5729987.1 DUF922 domain-containing protein [Rhizobium sp. SSA_523]WKC25062.1 DUF922 domain-containing protein [Rhizobium sp. SSA_523]
MSVVPRRPARPLRTVAACLCAGSLVLTLPGPALSQPAIAKTYSYFTIAGRTAEDLDSELSRRGPLTRGNGFRHPGATEIKFGGEVTYKDSGSTCAIGDVKITLKTKIILPRWKNRRQATGSLALIWDTLSADIKRHEERHAEIARSYARRLEQSLRALPTASTCSAMEESVGKITHKIIDEHDRDQLRFDLVEAKNFDARMMRLLKYRSSASD